VFSFFTYTRIFIIIIIIIFIIIIIIIFTMLFFFCFLIISLISLTLRSSFFLFEPCFAALGMTGLSFSSLTNFKSLQIQTWVKEKEMRHLIQEYGDGGFFIAPQGQGDLSPEGWGNVVTSIFWNTKRLSHFGSLKILESWETLFLVFLWQNKIAPPLKTTPTAEKTEIKLSLKVIYSGTKKEGEGGVGGVQIQWNWHPLPWTKTMEKQQIACLLSSLCHKTPHTRYKTMEKQQIACILSSLWHKKIDLSTKSSLFWLVDFRNFPNPLFSAFQVFLLSSSLKKTALLVVATLLFLKCYQNSTPSENNISPPSPFETLLLAFNWGPN